MRLKNIDSKLLLPSFVENDYFCAAFDEWIKRVAAHTPALNAPFTLSSIQAMTDEELQTAYAAYGIAKYYPDLPRETRNIYLLKQFQNLHILGTKKAVVDLLKYVFNRDDVNVLINDNLCYDSAGDVIEGKEDLVMCYDISITLPDANFDENGMYRLMENLREFVRNTAKLNAVTIQTDVAIDAYTPLAVNDIPIGMSVDANVDVDAWGVCVFYDYDMTTTGGNRVQYIKIMKEVLGYSLGEAKAIIDRVNETRTFVTIRYKTDGITSYTYENTLASYSATRAKVKACYDYVIGSFTAVDGCFGIYKNAPKIIQIQRLYRS